MDQHRQGQEQREPRAKDRSFRPCAPFSAGKKSYLSALTALLVLFGAGYRIALATLPAGPSSADAIYRYEPLAQSLRMGRGFTVSTGPPLVPNIREVPLYPAFLATVYRVSGGAHDLVGLLQLAMGGFLAWTVWAISRELGLPSAHSYLAAAAIWAAPHFAALAINLVTETLATLLVSVQLCCLVKASRHPASQRWWVAAGLLAGLNVLIRPDAYSFALLSLLAVPVACRQLAFHTKARATCLYGAVIALVLLPWSLWIYGASGRTMAPGWLLVTQGDNGWHRWLNTWVDDWRTLERYGWIGFGPGEYPDRFPSDKVPDDHVRAEADAALARAKKHARLDGPVSNDFDVLAEANLATQSRTQRAFRPFRRVWTAWFRVPTHAIVPDSVRRPFQLGNYASWIGTLTLALYGGLRAIALRNSVFLFPLVLILARTLLPMNSMLGLEARYMYEALGAIYPMAAFGLFQLARTLSVDSNGA